SSTTLTSTQVTILPSTTIIPSTTILPSTTIFPSTTILPSTTIQPSTTIFPSTTTLPSTITQSTAPPSTMSTSSTTTSTIPPFSTMTLIASTSTIPSTTMSSTISSTNTQLPPTTTTSPLLTSNMSTTEMSTTPIPSTSTTMPSTTSISTIPSPRTTSSSTTMFPPTMSSRSHFLEPEIPVPSTRHPRETRSSTVEPYIGYGGSASEINYIKKAYDQEEDARQEQAEASLNQKMSFANYVEQDAARRNFNTILYSTCRVQHQQLGLLWRFMQLDATLGVRSALGREDITARMVGVNILLINKCSPVEARRIYKDHKLNGSCYEYTPVETVTDDVLFIIPGSRDLTRVSPTVECGEQIPIVYEDDERFYSQELPVNVSTLPGEKMDSSPILTMIDFKSPGFYESIRTSSFPTKLAVSFGQQIRSLRLQQIKLLDIIEQPSGFKSSLSLINSTSNVLQNITNSLTGQLLEKILLYGGIGVGVLILFIILICGLKLALTRCLIAKVIGSVPINRVETVEMEEAHPTYTFQYSRSLAVNAVSSSSAPHIPITINDRVISALWDTGSSATFFKHRTATSLGISTFSPTSVKAIGVGGQEFKFIGKTLLPIEIGGLLTNYEVMISNDKDCPAEALIGTDFMKSLESENLQFDKFRFTTANGVSTEVLVKNKSNQNVTIHALSTIGVSNTQDENLHPYCPKELLWNDRLPEKKELNYDFMSELNLSGCKLTEDGKKSLKEIIRQYSDAFFTGNGQPGCFKGPVSHTIITDPALPLPKPEMQRSSPRIQGIINCMESDEDSPLSRKYRRKFILKNGLLHPLVPEDANFEIDKKTKEGNMEEIWRQLKTTIESNNQRQLVKFKRNRRVRNREVRSGDAVLVNRAPPAHKLTAKRDGPFIVTGTNDRMITVATPTG
ncbi:hypothetical protein PENTCL1PPCAC_4296, partial [Pristionchus entomophagus]